MIQFALTSKNYNLQCVYIDKHGCADFNHLKYKYTNVHCSTDKRCSLYKLQLVQVQICTCCNLYRFLVQVAAYTKSQLVHNIYIFLSQIIDIFCKVSLLLVGPYSHIVDMVKHR